MNLTAAAPGGARTSGRGAQNSRRAAFNVKTVEIDAERSLHAAISGTGRDMVLIHGAVTTHRDWLDGPFEDLAKLGRVIAVDRPGHGLSRRARFEGSPQVQAAQIRQGLQALGVKRPVLIGHSFGCLCALAYAEAFPNEVSHLILISPLVFPELRLFEHLFFAPRAAPILGPALVSMVPQFVDRTALEAAHEIMFAPDKPDRAWRRNYPWDQILDADASVANAEDSAAVHPMTVRKRVDLRSIRAPVHVINGTSDMVVNHALQAWPLAATLPNARHVRLEGVGHMAHRSRPDAVVAAAREALGKKAARGTG